MKIYRDILQGSPEWSLLRSGIVTASEMDALVSPTGEVRKGAGVTTYVNQKVCEGWIGGPLPSVQGVFDMEQGKILEERAIPAFTFLTGIETERVGFVIGDDTRVGCSPDALCNAAGLECKAPRMDTHVGYILAGKLPAQYVAQVQTCMFVCNVDHWHFYSYRHSFPHLHLVIVRDEAYQEAINTAVNGFYKQYLDGIDKLTRLNGGPPKRSPLRAKILNPQPNEENIDINI
jgi:YqaJ-like viral recombinase domain